MKQRLKAEKKLRAFLKLKKLGIILLAQITCFTAFLIPLKTAKPSPDGFVNAQPLKVLQTGLKELPAVIQTVEPLPEPTPQAPAASGVPAASGCVSGYSTGDYYLDKIIAYESGGNSCATNYLGCFGLLQACAGPPLREACGGNPDCQIAWFKANKTGGRSWAQVWQHELDFGWW